MVLVVFGLILRILARFRWTVQSDAFSVVVAKLLARGASAYLLFLVEHVRP